MGSKKFVPVTDDKNNLNEKSNFSLDRVELKDKIGEQNVLNVQVK